MINPKQLPDLEEDIGFARTQLTLFHDKISGAKVIEPQGKNTPEQEKKSLLARVNVHKDCLDKVLSGVKKVFDSAGTGASATPAGVTGGSGSEATAFLKKVNPLFLLDTLTYIDETLDDIKVDVAKISEEQYECKLDLYKIEIARALDAILNLFDFLIPNIRHEISQLERYYRIPQNASNSILPELNELMDDISHRKISLKEFLNGYEFGGKRYAGYDELRSRNRVFSRYQFYENPPEYYKEINKCVYEIRSVVELFLSEKRGEPEFGKFYDQSKEMNAAIAKMSEIFDAATLYNAMIKKMGKKYSYREDFKKAKSLVDQFNDLQTSLIVYFDKRVDLVLNEMSALFTEASDKNKFQMIVDEMKRYMGQKKLTFTRLEMVLAKLAKKDFNIVIQEKAVEDITIDITPHHENKYGKDILERINIIIMEIDFWYPPEPKQLLFQNLAKTTEKIQADEPVDKQEFYKLMQSYDQEIEKSTRVTYPDKIKELSGVYGAFQKNFALKMNREKLEKRLANKGLWAEIDPKLKNTNKSLLVLASGNPSLKTHVNKFSFVKMATEEMCQVLYDLSMQIFILFPGVDTRSTTRMTDILSTYNEFYEVAALWQAFSHYYKKTALPNLSVNESMMLTLAKTPRSKARLDELFPKEPSLPASSK